MSRLTKVSAICACLIWSAAIGSARAGVTVNGEGPETTMTAPHTTAVGQTVPPGGLGADRLNDPTERTQRQKSLDRVLHGICEGCR